MNELPTTNRIRGMALSSSVRAMALSCSWALLAVALAVPVEIFSLEETAQNVRALVFAGICLATQVADRIIKREPVADRRSALTMLIVSTVVFFVDALLVGYHVRNIGMEGLIAIGFGLGGLPLVDFLYSKAVAAVPEFFTSLAIWRKGGKSG